MDISVKKKELENLFKTLQEKDQELEKNEQLIKTARTQIHDELVRLQGRFQTFVEFEQDGNAPVGNQSVDGTKDQDDSRNGEGQKITRIKEHFKK